MLMSQSQKLKLQGTVIENHRGDILPDCFVKLKMNDGKAVTVVYHSEFPPAINYHAGDIGYGLHEGDQVEIYARIIDQDRLSTCLRNEYYIRKLK